MFFIYGEDLYIKDGVFSRPISIFSNGLVIPPLYFKNLIKGGGFIRKDDIDHIEVKWHKKFIAAFTKDSGIIWYDAPLEFIVHLKNGKRIRSRTRPPETIHEAVEIMHTVWGVKVERQGFGNGRMRKIVNKKVVEEKEL